jgi:hypothetical protein
MNQKKTTFYLPFGDWLPNAGHTFEEAFDDPNWRRSGWECRNLSAEHAEHLIKILSKPRNR